VKIELYFLIGNTYFDVRKTMIAKLVFLVVFISACSAFTFSKCDRIDNKAKCLASCDCIWCADVEQPRCYFNDTVCREQKGWPMHADPTKTCKFEEFVVVMSFGAVIPGLLSVVCRYCEGRKKKHTS